MCQSIRIWPIKNSASSIAPATQPFDPRNCSCPEKRGIGWNYRPDYRFKAFFQPKIYRFTDPSIFIPKENVLKNWRDCSRRSRLWLQIFQQWTLSQNLRHQKGSLNYEVVKQKPKDWNQDCSPQICAPLNANLLKKAKTPKVILFWIYQITEPKHCLYRHFYRNPTFLSVGSVNSP